MRNLKRALSLTLASVMLLGMMVVGTSAASFPDVTEKDNVEAIEVLAAVKVLQGYDDGQYHAENPVTRNQMATIICRMMGWRDSDYAGLNTFPDVPDWAANYVAACAANGIINGRDDGRFHGDDTVTATEAASMMLRALGYTRMPVGADWARAVAQQASKINLFDQLNVGAYTALTRGDVAQLSLNTLQSTLVDVKDNTLNIEAGNGVSISGGQIDYIVRTAANNSTMARAIKQNVNNAGGIDGTQGQTIELGEQVFNGDLKRTEPTDDFQNPAVRWTYKTKEVGTYAKSTDLTYTKEVKFKDIYKDLGLSQSPAATVIAIDGVKNDAANAVKANDGTDLNGATLTDSTTGGAIGDLKIGGKGSVTKVYYEEDDPSTSPANEEKVTITVTNYFLAKATEDYDSSNAEVDVDIYDGDTVVSATVKNEDIIVSNVEKDDYLVVTKVNGDEVKTLVPATIVADVQVSSARAQDYVNAGQKYEYNDLAKKTVAGSKILGYDLMTGATGYSINDDTYNLYLDPQGYVVGVEKVEGDANVSDYLVVTKAGTSNVYDVVAKVMFADGSEKTITVSKIDSNDATTSPLTVGKFFTFKEKSNGEYELKTVQNAAGSNKSYSPTNSGTTGVTTGTIDNTAKPVSAVSATGTSSTVFIADGKVYTGVKNAPKVTLGAGDDAAFYVLDKDNRLLIVWTAQKGKTQTSSDDLVYILNENCTETKEGDDPVYLYRAIYKGEVIDNFRSNDDGLVRGLYEIGSYSDGRADLSVLNDLVSKKSENTYVYGKGMTAISGKDNIITVTGAGAGYYLLTDDAKIYTISGGNLSDVKEVSADSLSTSKTITKDKLNTITVVREKNEADANVIAIYLSKAAESPNAAVTPGAPVHNPTSDELKETIGDGTNNSTVSGNLPAGTFGGDHSNLPTLTFDGVTVDGNTVLNGDSVISAGKTTTIGAEGELTTLAIDMRAAGAKLVVKEGGTLSCIDINVSDESVIVWGDDEYTFSAPLYFHVKSSDTADKGKIEITNTNTGTKVTTTSTTGNWKDALDLAVAQSWAAIG